MPIGMKFYVRLVGAGDPATVGDPGEANVMPIGMKFCVRCVPPPPSEPTVRSFVLGSVAGKPTIANGFAATCSEIAH